MRASGYDRVANDWYVEPRWAIDALLDAEPISGLCWDPSCGGGNIPEAIKARGLPCLATDIADRGYGQVGSFFNLSERVDNIISNPPYGVISDYLARALRLADHKVILLARLAFLEGKARRKMFAETPLARVWVSSRRMSMPPGLSDIEAKGGAIAYAWFVWEAGYTGKPVLGWI